MCVQPAACRLLRRVTRPSCVMCCDVGTMTGSMQLQNSDVVVHDGPSAAPTRRRVSRKKLLSSAVGLGAAGALGQAAFQPRGLATFAGGTSDDTSGDTPLEIFTAALIAEDLATTFYYNGLVGPVITDPNLAGPGGTATNPDPAPNGNVGTVDYLRAALSEEIEHANLFRTLLGGTTAQRDPIKTFYFPTQTFEHLRDFLSILNALESAFIGAYLAATQEFAEMAADTKAGVTVFKDASGNPIASATLEYYAKVASAILGVESEHRTLGRVISNSNPANNLCYEQTDGITSVYNGSSSAVAALTPFLTAGSGKVAYSFLTARDNAYKVTIACTGGIPPM